MKPQPEPQWPRIRYLPAKEQEPFRAWLVGQTRPWIDGEADDQQDAFYEHDYRRWKAGLPVLD